MLYQYMIIEEDDKECEYFTVISVDSLLVYENKYYLQVHLDNKCCDINDIIIKASDKVYSQLFLEETLYDE